MAFAPFICDDGDASEGYEGACCVVGDEDAQGADLLVSEVGEHLCVTRDLHIQEERKCIYFATRVSS